MIARKAVNEKGEKAILITTRTYSNSTAKHVSYVYGVLYGINQNVIRCPYPDLNRRIDNFKWWQSEAEEIIKMLGKARKPDIYVGKLQYLKQQVISYCNFIGFEIPQMLNFILSISDKEGLKVYETEKAKFERRALGVDLKNWFEGKRPYGGNKKHYDLIRYCPQRKEFFTSGGVSVPYEIALDFYNKLKQGIHPDKVTFNKNLYYHIETWETGTLKIGCHYFRITHLLRMGYLVFESNYYANEKLAS